MNISVITWDASFREYFHTVDAFGKQIYPQHQFEFIWVDYYNNKNPVLQEKIERYPNCKILNLGNPSNEKWHLGRALNEGIKEAKGDILVLPDGDIIPPADFLSTIGKELKAIPELVLYFRRWDEPEQVHDEDKSYKISYLKEVCKLFNPTNYAGTIALNRKTLEKVRGYEESKYFAGAGASGLELYIRLRNAGLPIKWHEKKIFHPYHPSTGKSDKYQDRIKRISEKVHWVNPYNGLEQSWIIHNRSRDLSYFSDPIQAREYIKKMPSLEDLEAKLDKRNTVSKFKAIQKKVISRLFTQINK